MAYSIGQLSAATGESVKTLRYWTDQGLLKAQRGENRYRIYGADVPAQVAFIRSAQGLGFRLETIARLLSLDNQGPEPCQVVEQEIYLQLSWVRQQIEQLKALEAKLMSQVEQAGICAGLDRCQFLPVRA